MVTASHLDRKGRPGRCRGTQRFVVGEDDLEAIDAGRCTCERWGRGVGRLRSKIVVRDAFVNVPSSILDVARCEHHEVLRAG